MDIIVTHEVSDFDALAAAVAARKLYPAASIALGKKLGSDVRDFLSLHKDRFPTVDADTLDAASIRLVVIVDVRRASRLGHVPALRERILARDPALQVHVWDHHPSADDDVPADHWHVEPIGSVTTLLVEALQRRALPVDEVEATLFALGVHVDTGSLRYAATTGRDAVALGWLLDQGANLAVINRYVARPFSDGQLRALSAMLGRLQVERIGGARIGVFSAPEGLATDGLDVAVSEVLALEAIDAVFACFVLRRGRLQLIARSREPWLDVGALLRGLGGGGHATAAAGTLRRDDPQAVLDQVLSQLRAAPAFPRRVTDQMSSPVHSVGPETSIAQLARMLQRRGQSGAVVIRGTRLVGVISRRDVDAAAARGRTSDRVAAWMSQPVHTIGVGALLEDALAVMVKRDIGRLPVMRGHEVVGIVTRRDVLRALYGR